MPEEGQLDEVLAEVGTLLKGVESVEEWLNSWTLIAAPSPHHLTMLAYICSYVNTDL